MHPTVEDREQRPPQSWRLEGSMPARGALVVTGDDGRTQREFSDGSRRPSFRLPTDDPAAHLRHFLGPDGKELAPAHCDSHMHPTNYVQKGLMPHEAVAMMNHMGVRNSTLMPIPTSIEAVEVPANRDPQATTVEPAAPGTSGTESGVTIPASAYHHGPGQPPLFDHHCGSHSYYIPDSLVQRIKAETGEDLTTELISRLLHLPPEAGQRDLIREITEKSLLYVDTAVNAHLHQMMRMSGLDQADRSRLDPMLTGFALGDGRAGEKLIKELCMFQGTFTGVGEITVHKELVQEMYADQKGQVKVEAEANRLKGLKNLLEMAGVVGMPVVLHCDIDDLNRQVGRGESAHDFLERHAEDPLGLAQPPKYLAGLEGLFKDERLKDTKIVWAHGGGLGRFVKQGSDHIEQLDRLMHECPNLHLDISWSAVADQITAGGRNSTNQKKWVAFIEKHADRICFGSDTLAPRDPAAWRGTIDKYGDVLSQLTPRAKDRVLNGTYEQVFVDARERVRTLERDVLTPAFHTEYLMSRDREEVILSAADVRNEIARVQREQQEARQPQSPGARHRADQLRAQASA